MKLIGSAIRRVLSRASSQAIASLSLAFFVFNASGLSQTVVQAQVDFSLSQSVHNESGFLEGATHAAPSPSNAAALQPGLWRLGMYGGTDLSTVYTEAIDSHAIVHYVVSDRFCYVAAQWCGRGAPYLNWTLYESMVQQAVSDTAGMNVKYDVWNEPDNPQFWSGTQAQFYEAYLRAYKVLRAALGPNAIIGGPSAARGYNKAFIKGLLDYCVANGCQVNFLSWHELDDTDAAIASISSNLKDARASFLNNPAYAALHIQSIEINETTAPVSKDYPGAILGYMYQLEQGGADAAARSCWNDSTGQSTCFNQSLDGLLTSNGWPRASWWAYKSYSDGVATRVNSESSDSQVSILASRSVPSASAAQILIGYYNYGALQSGVPNPAMANLRLSGLGDLPFLSGAKSIQIKIEKIPALGEAAVSAPTLVQTTTLAWQGAPVYLNVGAIQNGEAFRLTITKP